MENSTKEQLQCLISENKKEIDFYQSIVNARSKNSTREMFGWLSIISILLAGYFGGFVSDGTGMFLSICSVIIIVYYFKLVNDDSRIDESLRGAKIKEVEYVRYLDEIP